MSDSDPSKRESEEVDERQLELAREEGDAYRRSVEYMANEVANAGGSQRAGDYVVAYALEEAEGLYRPNADGDLEWTEPTDENCHLEVSVRDADDDRFVPELDVRATLVGDAGNEVGPVDVPFVWHPGLHHYGVNLRVPGDGEYTLRVTVDPPSFARHDRANGDRYADAVEVVFEDVPVTTGQG